MIERLKSAVNNKANGGNVTFWFIRHAESEGNVLGDDCPVVHDMLLTLHGRQEAERAALYFKDNRIKVTDIYTASRVRACETAKIIAEVHGLGVKIKERLSERNWGAWKDLRWKEVSEILDKLSIQERYEFVPEGGESWKEMEKRLFDVLFEIVKESEDLENIVIVLHRGGLRALLPKLVARGIETHAEFSVKTGSISKFSFQQGVLDFVGLVP